MDNQNVALPLKQFLLIDQCPPGWKGLDLYLFRDEQVVFYVGQSQLAFGRVWEHLLGGFKGHSIVGRFVWANWPRSMKFTIELLSSQSAQFADVGCKGCHGFAEGEFTTTIGKEKDLVPNLKDIASKVGPHWAYHWIKNPRGFSPDTRLPSLRLADEEALALTSYLMTLGCEVRGDRRHSGKACR